MSKYRFSICSYHAIKEADIIIDGITVLQDQMDVVRVLYLDGYII